ncbi:hypothetical protein GCM10020254_64370 [Streptomyces goshikiensis]
MLTDHRPLLSQSATQSQGHSPPGPQSPGPVPITPGEPGCAAAGPGAGGGGAEAAEGSATVQGSTRASAAADTARRTRWGRGRSRKRRSGTAPRYAAPADPRPATRRVPAAHPDGRPATPPETASTGHQLRTTNQHLARKRRCGPTVHSSGCQVRFRSLNRRDPTRRSPVEPGEPGTARPPHA